ncbi:MAG: hypothetical protein HQK79_20150 [Desulfobacterales bacterium]|nr:hypothetical protein [Desulfobacterales bacterium]
MQISPLRSIARELPFFTTVEDRENFLGIIGALVLRKISLKKASEVMHINNEGLLGMLDAMNVNFSYLEEQDIELEKVWQ